MELSINDIISLLWKRSVLIVACTISCLFIFFAFTKYAISPTYTASVQLYVNSNNSNSTFDLNDLNYAQKVVNTYINFLKTKVFYIQVVEESKLNYSASEVEDRTEISSVNNTEIFQISVTTNSAEDSYLLVTAMQKLAPLHIKSIKEDAQISVVDPAVYPTGPSGPNILFNSAVGGLLGLFLSISFVFLWEILDVNVKNQDDLKRKYSKPVLGVIPDYYEHRRKGNLIQMIRSIKNRISVRELSGAKKRSKIKNNTRTNAKIKARLNGFDNIRRDEVIKADTDFLITEAYKELRTNLRYTLNNDGCKRILVNSPISQDGKSTICTNLGLTIAQTGARVLLIDCDLRKGRLHNFLNLKSNPGMSELLIGMIKEKDALQQTRLENLQVISLGKIPPNPTELLSGGQMEEILRSLEKSYDFILIDSPPVNVVSDALSLTKLVDGVILVVRENFTSHPNIAGALTKLEFVNAKILGFVINGVSMKRGNKTKSKYYYNDKND